MEIMNSSKTISDKTFEEKSRALENMFYPVYQFPFIFVETYRKKEDGTLISEIQGGTFKTHPVLVHNNYFDKTIDVVMNNHTIYHKIGEDTPLKEKGNIRIPVDSNLINMEQMLQNEKITGKTEVPKGENIALIYLGKSAAEYFMKTLKEKEK